MPIEPTIRLTDEQIHFYHENGYLVLDQISTPDELENLRQIYDRLFSERAGREKGDQFDLAGADEEGETAKLPQILGPSQYAPEMLETLAWANGGAIMAQLWGQEGAGRGDHAILKPARYGSPTPWHQDEAYWDPALDYTSLSIWMPLQDVDAASGCMHFVPGSHKSEIHPHRPIGNDPRVHGLELDPAFNLDLSGAVGAPLRAGGCTIHHQRTLHYAPGNVSDIPRRAWIMMGGLPATPREKPADYYWQKQRHTAREERAKKS
ncbi:phytanoyl-CoA dioxygenase family protein [Fimbriimonas ginsengisoli]|uniref:Phytanoyl-CoA dioxygenase n=1 Tax=Fimbriimonas ginsengisoli Gsoil 348 TaxID=661478 RepID=A0A068NSI3_FIMGI|nr:phytanoyl-CoA dioxygenase family protein [Fimbriimonas ginsengisoli]AIE86317.1 Phytanoyl-CoA dioxygenase [Fimbriimonas ginsengisoli Gsoil 348]